MNNKKYFDVTGEDVLNHLDDLLSVTPESTHYANRLLYYIFSDYFDRNSLYFPVQLYLDSDYDYEMNLDIIEAVITTLKRSNPHLRLSLIEALFLSYKWLL